MGERGLDLYSFVRSALMAVRRTIWLLPLMGSDFFSKRVEAGLAIGSPDP